MDLVDFEREWWRSRDEYVKISQLDDAIRLGGSLHGLSIKTRYASRILLPIFASYLPKDGPSKATKHNYTKLNNTGNQMKYT